VSADFRDSLPFPKAAPHFLHDSQLRGNLRRATATIREKRNRVVAELPDFEALRESAAAIKDDALGQLDGLLEELERTVTAAGGHVHFAADAVEANRIVVDIVQSTGVTEVVKVKSMVTAETRLNDALAVAGIDVAETDLAELIVQLGDDLPSHIVVPAIHRNRSEVRDIFLQHMAERGLPAPDGLTDDPADLAGAARAHLRRRFLRAKVAISGANFAIAESGSLVVVESEGNGRMCVTLPETLISLVGIDKVLPSFSDLEVFLQLLARSATGERMNPYTSIWSGVSPSDGPGAFHLVLLDNGRSSSLADRVGRQALRCIRCAACLNVCPVYERVGGHAYGSVYPGPIGAVLTPQLHDVASDAVAASLPFASTLCGACYEVCPVRIDIPRLLVHLRARSVDQALERGPSFESVAMAAAGVVLSSPRRLATAERLAGRISTPIFRKGRIGPLPGLLSRWTGARDAPLPARQSFRDWWRTEHEQGTESARSHLEPARRSSKGPGRPLGVGHLIGALRPVRPLAGRSRAPAPAGPEQDSGSGGLSGSGTSPLPTGREAVLGAVRQALGSAPYPPAEVPRAYRGAGQVVDGDPVGLLIRRLSDYRANASVVEAKDLAGAVAGALAARGSRQVVVPAGLPEDWTAALDEAVVRRDAGELGTLELEELDATVTGCAVAIAETGTIVLDAGPSQGRRALSLVPDHLVVVVLAEQVVAGVPDGIARLEPSSTQTWISGPSATSDIELHRVEGVHGPRQLDVIVVAGS
jgi:L-lactate dehydrogenase complex protein LldF